jgi:hypothetical protein
MANGESFPCLAAHPSLEEECKGDSKQRCYSSTHPLAFSMVLRMRRAGVALVYLLGVTERHSIWHRKHAPNFKDVAE